MGSRGRIGFSFFHKKKDRNEDTSEHSGYHSSESTDEDSRKGSYEITTQDSGDSSDATSVGTNSQPGTVNSMTPGAAEAIATLKGEPSLSISMLKYDSTTYPTGAREKSIRPKGQLFLPESPPSSGDSTPSSSPQLQRMGCAPRFLSKSPKAGRGTQGQYDLSTAEAGQGDIPGYTEVDRAKTAKDEKRAKQSEKSSKDELVEAWKEIDGVTIKGFDRVTSFRAKKKERPALRVPKPEMSDKDKKVYQRRMLERKLKAKQAELESVDRLLGNQVVSATVLTEWREQHDDILKSLDGQNKDHVSSDSDPDSTTDMALSSSMSSINTNSTTTSTHDPTAFLGEDMTTVSDGTTSGCDVQTPMSDTASAIGEEEGVDTLKSTYLSGSTHLSPERLDADATRKADPGPVCDDGDSAFAKSEDGDVVVSRVKDNVKLGTGRSESEASETSL